MIFEKIYGAFKWVIEGKETEQPKSFKHLVVEFQPTGAWKLQTAASKAEMRTTTVFP